ncbi:MAG: CxxC-x17-CxxC domain-containing protein [Candidatus Omnitrophota bacterium]|jgi:CxxC-x17-CxxC domain-containing protein
MKKVPKSKTSQSAIAANQDIVGLITTLVEKLVSLETKINAVLSRLPERPVEVLRQQPSLSVPAERPKDHRQMFQVICADCGKNCEVPFRPSVGRPVYCKECFTKRKTGGNLASRVEVKSPEASPVQKTSPEKPPVVKPTKAPAVKKKPSAKKRKK